MVPSRTARDTRADTDRSGWLRPMEGRPGPTWMGTPPWGTSPRLRGDRVAPTSSFARVGERSSTPRSTRREAARRLTEEATGDGPLHVYGCPHCPGWHVGHVEPRPVRLGIVSRLSSIDAARIARSAAAAGGIHGNEDTGTRRCRTSSSPRPADALGARISSGEGPNSSDRRGTIVGARSLLLLSERRDE